MSRKKTNKGTCTAKTVICKDESGVSIELQFLGSKTQVVAIALWLSDLVKEHAHEIVDVIEIDKHFLEF